MQKKKNALDRLVEALISRMNAASGSKVVMQEKAMWDWVKTEVRRSQKAGFTEAMSLGKNPKPDVHNPWMGSDNAAFEEFLKVLGNDELKRRLFGAGYSVDCFPANAQSPAEIHISPV